MISELAKLLRISLSKGKTVIRISEELQHSKSYMNIQQIRYKDRFQVEFLIDKNVEECCTVKLVVQPLLENAIYYGVGNMDEDEGGKIIVRGEQKGNDIFLSVEDNGMGMSQEVVDNLLTNSEKVPKHGSGVGLINVHTRIQLMFGKEYGLKIYSEPDEGTKAVIHIPAIPYSEEKRGELENQNRKRERVEDAYDSEGNYIPYWKINAAYALGGEDELVMQVKKLLEIDVNYIVEIDYKAFRSIIDAIGGIEMYIDRNMDYDDDAQNLHIHFKEGETVLLDGEKSEEFIRWRKNNDGSGFVQRWR